MLSSIRTPTVKQAKQVWMLEEEQPSIKRKRMFKHWMEDSYGPKNRVELTSECMAA